MIWIAVDAMGGDFAPRPVVDGALAAARHFDLGVALVGPRANLDVELARHDDVDPERIRIVEATDVVAMEDSPAAALRRKPNASIKVAAEIVARGEASALFSAGHTGATVMAAYAAFGLLSIGEEATKGNELTREAHRLLRMSPLAFIGNVEARDVYSGNADVIVCDGFTGNVALKISEGLVDVVESLLSDELSSTITMRVGSLLTRRALRRFKRRVDYSEYGGAPLLGLAGVTIVGHGRSSAKAVRNAVALGYWFASQRFIERVEQNIEEAVAPRALTVGLSRMNAFIMPG